MRITALALLTLMLPAPVLLAQSASYPYIVRSYAGAFPLGDGGAATNALLYFPGAAVPDNAGNVYIADSDNLRIRVVAADGRISTFASGIFVYDLKVAADGTVYASGSGRVYKIAGGKTTVVAGTGTLGHSGDGGAALQATFGDLWGIALDSTGNIYVTETSSAGHYVRQILADGSVRTIAGTPNTTFNGDNQPATSANLYYPNGIAVDSTGVIYIADEDHSRIRKFTVGGNITTVSGNGNFAKALDGPATTSPIASPEGIWLDKNNNLYVADWGYGVLVKITAGGALSTIVGAGNGVYPSLRSVATDSTGVLYVVDYNHQVTRINLAGTSFPFAGRTHYGGDNGAATAALLNQPTLVASDRRGSLYIYDKWNYLVRKVSPAGTITTVGGQSTFGYPKAGLPFSNTQLGNYLTGLAVDNSGVLYFATPWQVLKVGTDGVVVSVAGNGNSGNSGDNGKATVATFASITGIALNTGGDLFIADAGNARVRKVDANTGIITAYAGNGGRGTAGDGGLATGAQLNPFGTMDVVVDASGNLYIGDGANYKVRMVDATTGLISTVVGNGSFGRPDSGPAKSAFSIPGRMAIDAAGVLYVASQNYAEIYKVSGGTINRISGTGLADPADGMPALNTTFTIAGLAADPTGDLYAADYYGSVVWKMVVNSPASLSVVDGSNQTGQPNQVLPKLLRVQLNGRAGIGVAGVPVTFAVTAGSAKLSLTDTVTDASGAAAVSLTLGATPGAVTVTATAAGIAPAIFTANVAGAGATCTAAQPVVTSAASAGDFGGAAAFASGSWLEIKGRNLASTTRGWAGDDFTGANAPQSLDGVSVTINGKPAYVSYISPGQINVQAPADTVSGGLPLVVTNSGCASAAFTVQRAPVAPGVLAPSAFNVGGRQYAAATFPDGYFVGRDGLIAGAPFRPAAPGDTITLYGIGFGDVNPSIPPGVIVSTSNTLPNFSVTFGSTPATVTFAGLVSGIIGLYQFNVVVPALPSGDYPIVAKVGTATAQTAYLTVASNIAPPATSGPNVTLTLTDVDPATPIATDNVRLFLVLANTGQIKADLATYVFLSTSPNLTPDNAQSNGPFTLSLNGSGGSYVYTVPLPSGIQPGTYYLALGATNPGNTDPKAITMSNVLPLKVIATRPAFDLIASLKSVTPQQAGPGDGITLVYNVTEPGGLSGTFARSVYLSTKPTVSTTDILLDTRNFELVRGGGDITSSAVILPKTLAPGTYYIGVIVDSTGDSNPANNTSNTLPFTVTADRIPYDLGVQVAGVTPSTIVSGGTFTVSYQISNKSASVGNYTRAVYLSTDGKISPSSQLLGSGTFTATATFTSTGQPASGNYTTTSITMPTTVAPGNYYIGMIIESAGDTNPSDNTSNAFPITVTRGSSSAAQGIPAIEAPGPDTAFAPAQVETNGGPVPLRGARRIR